MEHWTYNIKNMTKKPNAYRFKVPDSNSTEDLRVVRLTSCYVPQSSRRFQPERFGPGR